jgi:uncharacterized membrane protein YbhN (UPF0104 family)
MINDYLMRRAYIESVRGCLIQGEFLIFSFSCLFVILLGLPLFVSFVGFVIFPSSR